MPEKLFQFQTKASTPISAGASTAVSAPKTLTATISAPTAMATPTVKSPEKTALIVVPAATMPLQTVNPPKLFHFNSSAKQEKKTDDEVFKSLMKTEEKALEKKKSVLGELPKIDTSLFIDREYHLKKQLSVVRFLFAFLLLASFGIYVYFYSQLTPSFDLFGQNTAQKLEDKNSQLKNLQTELNFFRIQTAQVLLDRFTYLGDQFLKKFNEYQVAQADAKKAEILADLQSLREEMHEPFEKAREKLLAQNFAALFRTENVTEQEAISEFDQYLRDKIQSEQISGQLKSDLLQLAGKPHLKTLLQTNIREMTHEDLKEFFGKLALSYPNRLGFVYQIKQKRVPWARTIREIDEKTKTIDPLFRTGFFDKLGGVLYTSFDFDAATSRIAINGRAKSEDGTNFSILANLIDELEGSQLFNGVDMRSFSKRSAEGGSYEGSFKVDFFLQNKKEADEKDKKYNLNQ